MGMPHELEEKILHTAMAAGYEACRVLSRRYGQVHQVSKKGRIDLVTEADVESEKKIIASIRKSFPEHGILAEESGSSNEASEFQWIIDPLDGTTNFAHDLPVFSVSIALARKGETILGLVANPITGEWFQAQKGRGAWLNGKKIQVSGIGTLSESLLVTGFPYNLVTEAGPLLERFSNCLGAAQGVRRLGSAALDLCFVAAGRFEGFWEENLRPWDTAAGALIVLEAGGMVTGFCESGWSPFDKTILATNGMIHDGMKKILCL